MGHTPEWEVNGRAVWMNILSRIMSIDRAIVPLIVIAGLDPATRASTAGGGLPDQVRQ